jgi:hypothetical protein
MIVLLFNTYFFQNRGTCYGKEYVHIEPEYKFPILSGYRIRKFYEVLNRNKDHYFTQYRIEGYIHHSTEHIYSVFSSSLCSVH